MINSGGTASAFDAERTYGDNGNWCNILTDAEVSGVFESRMMAMNFATAVLQWLRSTDNMKQTSNITWCMLTDLPQTPEPNVFENQLMWEVTIPLQILYLTESEH